MVLCHSIQETAAILASWRDVPYEELTYQAAALNHQAWSLELPHRGEDLYPKLRFAVAPCGNPPAVP